MTDLPALFAAASATFDSTVRAVPDDAWDAQSPCEKWSVRDVVNHLAGEQLWVPHLLAGETVEDVGDRYDGNVLGTDPVAAWAAASERAVAAWRQLGDVDRIVHLSFGDVPAHVYAWQMIIDLTVHAWDVARGAGVDEHLDQALVRKVLAHAETQRESFASSGMFAPPTDRPGDDPQDRLLALTGR